MIKPITDAQLAQLDEWYKGYPSGDTAEPKQDFDSEVGMLYGAIRERIRLADVVVETAKGMCDHLTLNIAREPDLAQLKKQIAAYRAAQKGVK